MKSQNRAVESVKTDLRQQSVKPKIVEIFAVMPVKTGIQKSRKILDSASRWLSPACPE